MAPVRNRDISPFGIIFQDDVDDPGNGIRTVLGRCAINTSMRSIALVGILLKSTAALPLPTFDSVLMTELTSIDQDQHLVRTQTP